jgi:glycosyltransferase involved in cell wall biosynthesis
VLGKSNLTFKHPRLTFHGEYKREQFAEYVAKVKPHVGAVFSIWNETWCHTLTEMWSVGVPVAVTNYATLRSRVQDSGCGWVIEGVDTKQMYEFILGNIAQSSKLSSVVKNVVDMQSRELKDNSTYYMAQQYVTHYKIE